MANKARDPGEGAIQYAGADHARYPPEDAGGRRLPGRQECADARGSSVASHSRNALGNATVHGYGPAA